MSKTFPFDWLSEQAAQVREHVSAFMAQSPKDFEKMISTVQPPAWMMAEMQQKVILFVNHVLMQEPVARDRIKRQKGRLIQICWRDQIFRCRFTAAGLTELVGESDGKADLILRVTQDSPFEIAQTVLKGDKPAIHIEGDVQLAAEVNWLSDHVRWEPEEDLARLMGDAPAHALFQGAQEVLAAVRQFIKTKTETSAS
jgi:ubiquinone biosynthesis accessory factor UbiJ